MYPRRPPNMYRTVGRMSLATGIGFGVQRQGTTATNSGPRQVPQVHIPGVGAVPLGGGALVPCEAPLTAPHPLSSIAPSTRAPAVSAPGRAEEPVVKVARKASLHIALESACSVESRAAALADFEFDKVANSARASRASTWTTWQRMHTAWFGCGVPVLPLTVLKIKGVGAMFKAGHYLAFSNYASRAKAEHIDQFHVHGVPWCDELTVELKGALRSITRGRGAAKQAFPIDLEKIATLGCLDDPVVAGGPIGISDLLIIGSFFMARELEVACAKVGSFHIALLEAEVTWNMPVAKNDVLALGTHRTWGCICSTTLRAGCPFHAALRQLERLRKTALSCDIPLKELPFFPDVNGKVVDKVCVVASITKVMEMTGAPTKDALGRPMYGGHSMRTAGAVFLANIGVDTTRIEAMARWNSPMLLYYIRSAPLKSITKEFKLMASAQSSKTALCAATSGAQVNGQLAKVMSDLLGRLDKAVALSQENEDRLSSLEKALSPCKFVLNCASHIWHHTREHAAGAHCYTACGWHYTGLRFVAQADLPEGLTHKQLCGRCLPALRLIASTV